jgi:uncharacterized protein (TIGR03437 family)
MFSGSPYAAAEHVNGTLIGPATLYPGATTPAAPGETIVLYANGLGAPTSGWGSIVLGSTIQSGTLSTNPVDGVVVTIGGKDAKVTFAGLVSPGQYQINVVVPLLTDPGPNAITISSYFLGGSFDVNSPVLISVNN